MKKYLLFAGVLICLKITHAQNIYTIAGNGTMGFSGDSGLASNAVLNTPGAMALDTLGNVYFIDYGNSRIREIELPTGIIKTVAGNGTAGYSGDRGAAVLAQLNHPSALTFDRWNNMYIADTRNSVIRKVTGSTGIISTVAGNGTFGFSGDRGPDTLAQLNAPSGIAVDNYGNLYIADENNYKIRQVSGGLINTISGWGLGFAGDGGWAINAKYNNPTFVAVDAAGNVYIVDSGNNRVRMISKATGDINTIIGNGKAGFSGDGGKADSAEINKVTGLWVDKSGNIFIADANNNRIREVNTAGIINTVAGAGSAGFSGDGGLAILAELNNPGGVVCDASGNIYIADTKNNRIRESGLTVGIEQFNATNGFSMYPNPTKGVFRIQVSNTNLYNIAVYNMLGQSVFTSSQLRGSTVQDLSAQPNGVYIVCIITEGTTMSSKVIIDN